MRQRLAREIRWVRGWPFSREDHRRVVEGFQPAHFPERMVACHSDAQSGTDQPECNRTVVHHSADKMRARRHRHYARYSPAKCHKALRYAKFDASTGEQDAEDRYERRTRCPQEKPRQIAPFAAAPAQGGNALEIKDSRTTRTYTI